MGKSERENHGSWEEKNSYRAYKQSKMSQEGDIDYFRCNACGGYFDSYDESDKANMCLDCFFDDEEAV